MSLSASPVTTPGSTGTDDTLDHIYCCDENWSLCGRDLTGINTRATLSNLCVVCDDLELTTDKCRPDCPGFGSP